MADKCSGATAEDGAQDGIVGHRIGRKQAQGKQSGGGNLLFHDVSFHLRFEVKPEYREYVIRVLPPRKRM
jgi:hypothetical protein